MEAEVRLRRADETCEVRAFKLRSPRSPHQMVRARATTLLAFMVVAVGVPGFLCFCVVYTQVGLHACRITRVKVRGGK